MKESQNKHVMIFGVFDGIHDGHRHLVDEARTFGNPIIVVTQDNIVRALKNKNPIYSMTERSEHLVQEFSDAHIVAGDLLLNSWQIVLEHKPQTILLGYDQLNMEKTLRLFIETNHLPIHIEIATPFKPDIHHSSLLQKQ